MEPTKPTKPESPVRNLLWVGVFFGTLYWFAESALHVFIFHEGTVASQIFTHNLHEIWKRLSVFVLIISFSYYAQSVIKERRFNDQKLKELENKYQTLFEEGLIPILILDTNGCFIDVNRAALEFFENPPQALKGRSIWEYSVSEKRDRQSISFDSLRSQKNLEIDYLLNDKTKTLMINLVPYKTDAQKVIYGIGQDITKRKIMEREIQLAHTELNQIFQTASVGMRLIDGDFNVLKANETFSTLSGEKTDNIVSKKCYTRFRGGLCHTDQCPLVRVLKGEKEIEAEVLKYRTDGSVVHCLLTARPFYGPKGDLKGILESFKNINELKRIQEDLRRERDKLHRILFERFEGVGIISPNYSIEYLNDALKTQHGDCRGNKCYAVFREQGHPCKECIMQHAFASEKMQRHEFSASSGRIYEQTYTPFMETDGQKKVVIAIRDVTDVKAAKVVAYRSEQLAALGELAAGVAHEINNPINGIINYAQILINQKKEGSQVSGIPDRILKEGNRVARIVESLLSFSSREKQSKVPVCLSALLEESIALINAQMRKEAIQIKKDIPWDLPQFYAVPQEIQQVFINILSNARYSLNEKYPQTSDHKIIQIKAEPVTDGNTPFVRISFIDYGMGISPDILTKILNPFFSTKPRGVGTGVGLSISHSIVCEHGGKINIDSREDEYACVNICLPAAS